MANRAPKYVRFSRSSAHVVIPSFVGPIPEVAGCQTIKELSISCNTLNPEDLALTPHGKLIVVSEFGGIEPLSRPKAGRLILLNVQSKIRLPVTIGFAENTWGDKSCVQE